MITKALIGMSALISAGLVSAYETPAPPQMEISAAAAVAERFPSVEERFARPDQLMFSPVSLLQEVPSHLAPTAAAAPKRDKLPTPPAACGRQDWPYISAECLISADVETLKRQVRVITIERRYGENTSMLTAMQSVRMASR